MSPPREETWDPEDGTDEDEDAADLPEPSSEDEILPDRKPRVFEFENSGDPVRLDMFLCARLPDRSRSFFQKLIEDGQVTVRPAVRMVKRSLKVPRGAVVRLVIPPPRKVNLTPIDIPVRILYEDPHLAVIDKPAGLAVHPSPTQTQETLVNALLYRLQDLSSIGGEERPGIVHRLDKETSGVLLVAKNDFAHRALAWQFKERVVHKTYRGSVRGEPVEWEGHVDKNLGKSYTHSKKQMVRSNGSGRDAMTDYRVLEKYKGYALLEVYPRTGRTHQIRVHLLSLRMPIACDKLYGREKRITLSDLKDEPRRSEEPAILDRQALHAASIAFRHPLTQEEMVFSTPIHDDMHALLKALSRYRVLGR